MTLKLDGATAPGRAVAVPTRADTVFVPVGPVPRRVRRGEVVGRYAVTIQGRTDPAMTVLGRSMAGSFAAPVNGTLAAHGGGHEIVAPGLDVAVPFTPLQALRYRSLPFRAQATVESLVGRRRVDCDAAWLSSGTAPGATPEAGGAASAEHLVCRLPSRVESVPGLRAQVVLVSKTARQVLTVPVLAIGYNQATGSAYVDVTNGARRRVPVMLGDTDGVARVVTGDLSDGDRLAEAESS